MRGLSKSFGKWIVIDFKFRNLNKKTIDNHF